MNYSCSFLCWSFHGRKILKWCLWPQTGSEGKLQILISFRGGFGSLSSVFRYCQRWSIFLLFVSTALLQPMRSQPSEGENLSAGRKLIFRRRSSVRKTGEYRASRQSESCRVRSSSGRKSSLLLSAGRAAPRPQCKYKLQLYDHGL